MTVPNPCSLNWCLVRRLVALQAAVLTGIVLIVLGTLWGSGLLVNNADDGMVDVLREAVERDASGGLALRSTAELASLRAQMPDLWFVIRDRQGHVLSEGTMPPEYARIGSALEDINQGYLGWHLGDQRANARLKRVDTAAGNVQILTGLSGRLPLHKALLGAGLLFLTVVLPSLAAMALATLIVTPMVVRHGLRGLNEAAMQAERIDIDQRGARLPVANIPAEAAPLVKAVNDALGRLDEGYERHERFLANAAHELRTPIAILSTRLESLPSGPEKTRLIEDVARLSVLADELLDLQRLDQPLAALNRVDLVAIARRVASDLAPLAIAAGYELSFESAVARADAMGDQLALERALTNLVQNAIEHGGRTGNITIRVDEGGAVEVLDEGAGVAPDHRERIFEPFYRVQPLARGAGLGLNLVREIARRHRGHVSVHDRVGGGACFRMALPAIAPASA